MRAILEASNTVKFGPFLLGSLLGEGICHEVHEARVESPSNLDRTYALKRIARHAFDERVINNFTFEQEVSKNTNHPHLIKALETGSVDNKPYILLPKLREKSFDSSEAYAVLSKVASGLDNLHAQNTIHCDVSAKNILFDESDNPILIDFSASTQNGTKQNEIKGTHSSMSPEQVKGETLNHQSDLFSLAVVAWETITGNKLFSKNAPHLTVVAVVEMEVPTCGLGEKADAVFKRALNKIPTNRYDSCVEFMRALKNAS